MTYLLTQLYVWMAFACLLGFAAGWLLCSRRWSRKLEEQRERYRQHMARLEMDLRRVDENGENRDPIAPSADPSAFLVGDEAADGEAFKATAEPSKTTAKPAPMPANDTPVLIDADEAYRPPDAAEPVTANIQTAAALPATSTAEAFNADTALKPNLTAPIWATRLESCEKDIATLQTQLAELDKRCNTSPANSEETATQPLNPPSEPAAALPAYGLTSPKGEADDLKRIWGVGPKLESMLNDLGIFHFAQIAAFTEQDVIDVSERLDQFSDRISRDNWIEQARKLLR